MIHISIQESLKANMKTGILCLSGDFLHTGSLGFNEAKVQGLKSLG